ncbi:MAG: Maf family protein [Spirochaetia bacterium]|jgi:septum formation protein|nr:Maf family protein [Spirochaetia bacterium]
MDAIVLASASPRRKDLLARMGFRLVVRAADIDEAFPPGRRDFGRLCGDLARRKVRAVLGQPGLKGYRWFLGADTVVVKGRDVIGKPKDRGEARGFLARLQGATHKVVTGLCLHDRQGGGFRLASETSLVRFAKMSGEEIDWYLDTGEWEGVAGAYRIQGKGACFIQHIKGNYTNVMGLPLRLVYGILREIGYPLGIKSSGPGGPP